MQKITIEDLNMVIHFWQDRGDLERWDEWKKKKPLFLEEYPELVQAWNNYKASLRILDSVVDRLEDISLCWEE